MVKLKRLPNTWFESIQQKAISGTPDVIGCVNGVFVGLEFKRSSKSPVSGFQKHKINQINAAGGVALLCYPENFEEVLEVLTHLSSRKHE